jgi:hypothetical protein
VRLSDDFRDNLIIDRYQPDLAAMRGARRKMLRCGVKTPKTH